MNVGSLRGITLFCGGGTAGAALSCAGAPRVVRRFCQFFFGEFGVVLKRLADVAGVETNAFIGVGIGFIESVYIHVDGTVIPKDEAAVFLIRRAAPRETAFVFLQEGDDIFLFDVEIRVHRCFLSAERMRGSAGRSVFLYHLPAVRVNSFSARAG